MVEQSFGILELILLSNLSLAGSWHNPISMPANVLPGLTTYMVLGISVAQSLDQIPMRREPALKRARPEQSDPHERLKRNNSRKPLPRKDQKKEKKYIPKEW